MYQDLREKLLDANFLSLLYLQIDILTLVTTQSLAYQKRGSSFILEYERRQQFLNEQTYFSATWNMSMKME